MNYELKHSGFSLTEVLIAVGIIAVGMVFVAGVFPAGIYFTTLATERTIAAVTADEAFAKIRLYAVGDISNPADDIDPSKLQENAMTDFNDSTVFPAVANIKPEEFLYPSADTNEPNQYYWSALCRRTAPDPNRLVQVTVFVSRKVSPNLKYRTLSGSNDGDWPMPVKVGVSGTGNSELIIDPSYETYINDGYTIVDDATGDIYRVLERYKAPNDNKILLDRNWQGSSPGTVWVVPAPTSGGRYPCIAVYQKEIMF